MEQFPNLENNKPEAKPALGDKAKKLVKSIFTGAMLGTATMGGASSTSAQSFDSAATSQKIEQLRIERIDALRKDLAKDIEALRVHDDKQLFTESYKKSHTQEQQAFLTGELAHEIEQVEHSIDGLNETEVHMLIEHIVLNSHRTQTLEEINNESDSAVNSEEHTADWIAKYPHLIPLIGGVMYKPGTITEENIDEKMTVVKGSLEDWIRANATNFAKNVQTINSLDTAEHAKRFSEVFRKAVDMTEWNRAVFANKWLEEAVSDSTIDAQWRIRESDEYLRLSVLKKEKELSNVEKNLHLASVREDIDTERKWELAYIGSPEYLHKLITVEGIQEEKAKSMQAERVKAVQDITYGINPEYLGNSHVELDSNKQNPTLVYSALDVAMRPNENAKHELTHVALSGNARMTKEERALYEKARITNTEYGKMMRTPIARVNDLDLLEYLSDDPTVDFTSPAELAARKTVLEFEMEKLGIKKRFDDMTHEQYLQLRKLMNEGKLTPNSVQIILSTTEEGLLSIMNKIAYQDTHAADPIAPNLG